MAKGNRRAAASPPASPPARTGRIINPRGNITRPGDSYKAIPVTYSEAPTPQEQGGDVADPWSGKGTEAPSNLTPAADWQRPGEYLEGEYINVTMQVGPNKSRLYALKVGNEFVSVWGSTILDNRMDALNPPRGARIGIQYLGDVQTGRGENPAKLFRVKLL